MSSALFIVVEREVPGINASSVGGKSLSRNLDWLDEAARQLVVLPLSELISVNPEGAAAFLEGEGGDPLDLSFPSEQWFEASEGLRTIEALLQCVESQKSSERALLSDLKSCQRVLERAKQEEVRFHFAVDF